MSRAIPGEGDGAKFGLLPYGDRVRAYTQAAFQHFLAIERERCIRSGERCFLVLAELKGRDGITERMARATSENVFRTFSACLRETDFLGWHTEDRIAGAVLTETGGEYEDGVLQLVIERIRRTFERQASVELSSRLCIRSSSLPGEVVRTSKALG
jgi:hypothetical protein